MSTPLTPWTEKTIFNELGLHGHVHTALGIDVDFLKALISTSRDLQFLVTLAVIVEGATSAALRRKLSNDKLFDWILANVRSHSARLQLARDLGVVQDESFKSLRKLAEIRNQYAHGPHNLKRNLTDFYIALDPHKQKDIVAAFAYFLAPTNQTGPFDDSCFRIHFREALLTATMVPLFELSAGIAGK